uniref:U-box domain-containing protein 9 n=1 Tax=Cajanus cajan TaxID=3821 RepID=A0A151RRV4_CAJCA|nr:U-box domain-containing protein 9 [Cajanus cajan]
MMVQSFDRALIERWLNEVHRIFHETQQVLSHCILTPNCLLQGMICKWCKDHNVDEIHDDRVTNAHRHRMRSLLYKLFLSLPEQKKSRKRPLLFRMLFADAEAIHLLLSPLSPGTPSVELELHEDLITTLLNLSIHDDNKRALAKNEKVVSLIVDSLKMGTVQTRSNATAEVFSMSSIYSNRHILGKSEAIKYLVDLLDEGHPLSMNDAASALFKLCLACENKARTVREGAVQVILGKIVDKVMVDELVSLLVLLAKHSKAVEALVSHGVVLYLLDIVKETTSERVKENCVGILCTVCCNHREKMLKYDKTSRII